jgi:DNA-binding NarL/FixJ family response regulator
MNKVILKPNQKRILDLIIAGYELKDIAAKLKIKLTTLYNYIKQMKLDNDCNFYQLVYRYAQEQLELKYLDKKQQAVDYLIDMVAEKI